MNVLLRAQCCSGLRAAQGTELLRAQSCSGLRAAQGSVLLRAHSCSALRAAQGSVLLRAQSCSGLSAAHPDRPFIWSADIPRSFSQARINAGRAAPAGRCPPPSPPPRPPVVRQALLGSHAGGFLPHLVPQTGLLNHLSRPACLQQSHLNTAADTTTAVLYA
jgi:hypothetical protein